MKQKRSSIRYYDQIAPTYDMQYGEEQKAKISAALGSLHLTKSAVVLDAGCGTGLLLSHLAKKARRIVGIDISLLLLQKGKRKALRNAHVIRADADYQPFRPAVFSHAFAFTLIQNTPDPIKTLREIKRTAQPNAIIVITGLRKSYTRTSFMRLLAKAKLEILALDTDPKLKDYIAVCARLL